MEIICALLTFLSIMLYLKKRALIRELTLMENRLDFLEDELKARKEEEDLPPLDLSKLVIHT
jgi:hypothetical protein